MRKRKLKPGDWLTLTHEGHRIDVTVRRVGCNNPNCSSCEGHWRDEDAPPRRLN